MVTDVAELRLHAARDSFKSCGQGVSAALQRRTGTEADQLAARIVQLGGEPDLSPDNLSVSSHAGYVAAEWLTDMIRKKLVAQGIAIDSYRELISYLDVQDPTTGRC